MSHEVETDLSANSVARLDLGLYVGLFLKDELVQECGVLNDVAAPVVAELEAGEVVVAVVDDAVYR